MHIPMETEDCGGEKENSNRTIRLCRNLGLYAYKSAHTVVLVTQGKFVDPHASTSSIWVCETVEIVKLQWSLDLFSKILYKFNSFFIPLSNPRGQFTAIPVSGTYEVLQWLVQPRNLANLSPVYRVFPQAPEISSAPPLTTQSRACQDRD